MKRIVAVIVAFTFLLNLSNISFASKQPPIKANCIPVCALPFLPQIGAGIGSLTAWLLGLTAVTATVVTAYGVSKAIDDLLGKRKKQTIIYRRDNPTCSNMTPREWIDPKTGLPKDWSGLSYQLSKPVGIAYTATSLEAINESGNFKAIRDGIDHVSVRGLNDADHARWMNARPNCDKGLSAKTKILIGMSVHVKK